MFTYNKNGILTLSVNKNFGLQNRDLNINLTRIYCKKLNRLTNRKDFIIIYTHSKSKLNYALYKKFLLRY